MRGYWLFHPFTGYLGETTQRSISAKWVSLILLTGVVAICGCGGDDGGTSSAPPAPPQLPPTQPAQAQESPETPPVVPESPATPQDVAESQPPVEPVAQQPPAARQTQAFAPAADPQAFAKPTTLPTQAAQSSEATSPAGASPFETSYLDPATELFVFARPAAIASSPFVHALSGGKLGPLDSVRESFGISIDQIDSVTIGVSQLQKLAEQSAAQMTQQPSAADALQATMMPSVIPDPLGMAEHFIFVVRTTEDVKLEDLVLPEGDGFIKTHSSKLYRQLADLGEQSPHMFAPDEKTFVIATDSVIQSIIDQGETLTQATADLSFVSADSHLIVAVVPQDREAFFANLPAIPTPEPQPEPAPSSAPEIKPGQDGYRVSEEDEDDTGKGKSKKRRKKEDDDDGRSLLGRGIQVPDVTNSGTEPRAIAAVDKKEWQKLLETHAIGIALQIDLNEGLQLKITAQCDVPASPLRIQKELDVVVSQGKQAFEAVRSVLPGIIQEIAGSMVNSLTVTTDGTTVAISTTLPESQQANLTMLPMVVMGMMMSQTGNVEVMQQMVDWQERAEEVLNKGQLSVITEGLPEGLEVHGIARWSLPQPGQELSPPLLEVATVYTGGPGAFTRSFGRLKVTEASDASGVPLKWLGVSRNGRTEDPLHEMTAIDRTNGFTAHPPQGVATGLLFHPPGSDVQSLAVVAGEVVLEVPTSTREIMLHNVSSGPVSILDPVLQGTHFVVTTETVGSQTVVRCTYNDQGPVGTITLLDASGKAVEASNSSQVIVGNQVQREWQLSEETKLPLGLVVAVQENVQEVLVPFRFENIPMPEPVSRFSGQEPLGSWTTANKDSDFPDGLTLEAQTRWNSPQTRGLASSEGTEQGTSSPVTQPPKLSLTGRSGGLGFGKGRDEEEEDRPPASRGGGELSRKEEKRQRKDKKDKGDGSSGLRAGVRIAEDDDGDSTPAVRTPEPRAAQVAGSMDGRLQFVVDLIGPTVDSAVVIGNLQVESATGDGGTELEFEGGQFGLLDVTDDLADVEWDNLPEKDQPPNGLRVVYKFLRPESPVNVITEMKGSLHIRTVRERIEAIVPNLQDRVDKRIKDRVLMKYGVEIAVAIEDDELKFRTLKGDEERIDKMFPVDGSGARIDGVTHLTATDSGNEIHIFRFLNVVPEDVGMKFIINLGVEDIDVPVEFSNVPVPPAPVQFAVE